MHTDSIENSYERIIRIRKILDYLNKEIANEQSKANPIGGQYDNKELQDFINLIGSLINEI